MNTKNIPPIEPAVKQAVIIPALQPSLKVVSIVDQLLQYSYAAIIVINDGSRDNCQDIFKALETKERVVVLHHVINRGKGEALKTAFNYVLVSLPHIKGVITMDADGQHLVHDVNRLSAMLASYPDDLCLGYREMADNVPLRSRLGNSITKYIFRWFVGKSIDDTQTGLRGIPVALLPQLLTIEAERYEFELEMLIRACAQHIQVRQIRIDTVYENNNVSSHFRPILDSFKIYFVFVRFISASLISSVLDMLFFSIALYVSEQLFFSIVMGRIAGAGFNFFAVKVVVFQSKGNIWKEALEYVLLVLFLMMLSYMLITMSITVLGLNPYISKIVVETALVMMNFAIQKTLIFFKREY